MSHRVGFIGTGEIAALHAEAIGRVQKDWTIAGGFDLDAGAAQRFCARFGGRAYESAEAILAEDKVDTVYLCTRHDSHPALAALACRAGKNVFLEKPVALSYAGAAELLRTYREHPQSLAVGFNMRVAPATVRFCGLLKEHGAQVHSFMASMTGPSFMGGWASDPAQGGGVLVCQGSHLFDLIGYALGSPVSGIMAATQHLCLPAERNPNAAVLLLELQNGARGTLLMHDRGNAAYHTGRQGRMVSLTAYAPQGTFSMDAYGKVRWGTGEGYGEELPCEDDNPCVRWGYAAEAQEFGRLLESGRSALCTLEEGCRVAAVVEAARSAAAGARWTSVQEMEGESTCQ